MKIKLLIFLGDVIVYIENLRESTDKPINTRRKFNM